MKNALMQQKEADSDLPRHSLKSSHLLSMWADEGNDEAIVKQHRILIAAPIFFQVVNK